MSYTNTFNALADKAILVIGDVMVDEYIWGKVERISPEAPVPVVSVTKKENRVGGAANVAKNIATLGIKAIIASVIGTDEAAQTLTSILESRNIHSKYCVASADRKTTIKTRVLSGNHQILRVDNEQTNQISESEASQLLQNISLAVSAEPIAAIILQDYDKGVLGPKLIKQIISLANTKNIPVLVDPKKQNFSEFTSVQFFKPNFKEFTEGIGVTCEKTDLHKLFALSQSFVKQQKIDVIMITLSEHGIFIANQNEYFHLPTQVREVADVSGAGDTVISVASACFIAGLSMQEIARISNIAAGIVCEIPGVVAIQKEQLLQNI